MKYANIIDAHALACWHTSLADVRVCVCVYVCITKEERPRREGEKTTYIPVAYGSVLSEPI